MQRGGVSYYYTQDALGSTIGLSDANQAEAAAYYYDSWGNTLSQTGTQAANNPWQYAGGYKDAAAPYIKFGARYYDPTIGRFTQLDPSGQDPHYTYASNNPVSATDPTGLLTFWQEVAVAGIGIAAGAAVSAIPGVGPVVGVVAGGCASFGLTSYFEGGNFLDVLGSCLLGGAAGLVAGTLFYAIKNTIAALIRAAGS